MKVENNPVSGAVLGKVTADYFNFVVSADNSISEKGLKVSWTH